MPDLSPTIDSELEHIYSNFSGIDPEVVAVETSAGVSPNDSSTIMGISWINTLNVAVQYESAYMEFDTSDITSTPESATLKIYPQDVQDGGTDFYVCRAYLASAGTIVAGDLDAYVKTGPSSGTSFSNIVKYSSKVESLTEDEMNSITLNSTALADMVSRDEFQIALVTYHIIDDDLGGITDGSEDGFNIRSQDHSTSAHRPVLSYELPSVPIPNLKVYGSIEMNGGKIIIK